MLDTRAVVARLRTLESLALVPRVASTNLVARRIVTECIENELSLPQAMIIAGEQFAGRGRNDRLWSSPAGKGIYATTLVTRDPHQLALMPLEMANIVASYLRETFAIDARIKWPNDVLVDGKKIAGILIEARVQEDRAYVIIGTGANELAKTGMPSLAELATKHGYSFATTRAQLDAAAGAKLLAVFPEQTRDLDVPDAPLPALARTALARLRGHAKGFFLMIEHEGIDSSSHQNNVPDLIASLKSFDETVGVALDFAAANPGTLVLVTGDHETGSLRISETRSGRIRLEWATIEHTATAIPVFAFGPGANAFGGVYDNTDIGKRLIEIVGR